MLTLLDQILEDKDFSSSIKNWGMLKARYVEINGKTVGIIYELPESLKKRHNAKYKWSNWALEEHGYCNNHVVGATKITRPLFEKWYKKRKAEELRKVYDPEMGF